MIIERIPYETHKQFLEVRKEYASDKISSTECAPLFGHGAWGVSFYQLWHVKYGNIESSFKETEQTKSGLRYETCIAAHFEDDYKCNLKQVKAYHYCEEFKVGSSYDFIALDGEYKDYIIETKNLISFGVSRWEDDEPPKQYQIQCQHQLMLYPEAKGAIICALIDGWKLQIFIVERDHNFIAQIKKRSLQFWKTIEESEAPDIDLNDVDSVKAVNRHTDDSEEEANEDQENLAMKLIKNKSIIKELELETKKIQATLQASTLACKLSLKNGQSIDMKYQKGSEGKEITQDMVGSIVGAKSGYRRCQSRGKAK